MNKAATDLPAWEVNTVVIGAGVVGLATARELACRGRQVLVLEAASHFGEGISSRNSEVIHAGIYYPAGSLKAELCVAGRELLYRYCEQQRVAHRKTGKWIVATSPTQQTRLQEIQSGALNNGVSLQLVVGSELRRALPDVVAAAALYSSETGIVDSHGLMTALLADLQAAGGQLVCRAPVISATNAGSYQSLVVGGEEPCRINANHVVNSAGLDAVPLARQWQGYKRQYCPELHYARGVYFSYSGRHPFSQLIYPVPEPGGLGVHLTLDLAGQARFGPDVEWISHPDYSVDPGRKQGFVEGVRAWWPQLDPERLQPAYAGVRPKLSGPGAAQADFMIQGETVHGVRGLVHLFGIESPGLTASFAIAARVADQLL